jgi:hypothetical protein
MYAACAGACASSCGCEASMSNTIQWIGAGVFALAILHTFSTKFFERLAHARPQHSGMWHLLGEVEVVFGFWAMVLVLAIAAFLDTRSATSYLDTRNYTEPMFVFAIMVVAGSRSILHVARWMVIGAARAVPLPGAAGLYFVTLSLVPLLGSFITEPAAMTLAALMLSRQVYRQKVSNKLKYATLGVLFVNVSIGGTLTPFAAPPVLMVAAKWNWGLAYMFEHFGWRAAAACGVSTAIVVVIFWNELKGLEAVRVAGGRIPAWLTGLHLLFLALVVAFAHYPNVFFGIFVLFLGLVTATREYQDGLKLREGLLVGFFLAGLVTLGSLQAYWLKPLIQSLNGNALFFGATGLTAITDNAALTYLGSLVEGISDELKYALVAGAVAGGGLTVIANAPNPAGVGILQSAKVFEGEGISPLGLFLGALMPTAVAIGIFWLLH